MTTIPPGFDSVMSETERAHRALMAAVNALQGEAAATVLDWAATTLETEGGKIKYTARNLGRVQQLAGLMAKFQKRFQNTVLGRILQWADRVLQTVDRYFGKQKEVPETLKDRARKAALLRWGYDVKVGKLVTGGYLETVFAGTNIGQRVAALVNRAIASNMSLAQFQKTFRAIFTGAGGVLNRYFNTNTFDLFQRIDRTAAYIMAQKLGLKWAVYSGTLIETSRPFCIARANNIYSETQIASWANLNFKGKPKVGYDPFVDCGGFNCRHHLAWVTDEIAEHIKTVRDGKN